MRSIRKLLRLPYCLLLLLLLSSLISGSISLRAEAAASLQAPCLRLTADTELAQRRKKIRVTAHWKNSDDLRYLSAFRLHLQYDKAYLTLTDIEPEGADSGDFYTHMTSETATAVYASNRDAVPLADGACCTFVFDVNEDAPAGSASVTVSADELVTRELEKLPDLPAASVSVKMARVLSDEALLESLTPSAGELTPRFSPETTEYALSVPYDVTQLTFDTVPKNNATVRVNRKNLGKAGSSTTFILTVTAENGKDKTEYIVTATRGEKAGASSQNSSQKTSSGTKKSSGTKGSSASSKKTDGNTVTDGAIAAANGGLTQYGNKIIYYNQDTYSVFIIGALCALACVLAVALILFFRFWLRLAPGKKNQPSDPKDTKKK